MKLASGAFEIYPQVENAPLESKFAFGMATNQTCNARIHSHCRLYPGVSRRSRMYGIIDKGRSDVRLEKDVHGNVLRDARGKEEFTAVGVMVWLLKPVLFISSKSNAMC